ncbi:PAS-domain containing protein [Aestuariispira insulae]|uniref:histidine kinase n=1 Tax=Aestuariispira insulae TaxID=1461337 RepID=A0A3D9HG96_9PROT|nr:PAS-domain containing protein [Aestuariispira insulae]RED48507.1 signal transduction histidine kinase [Aestuariispira insulae]
MAGQQGNRDQGRLFSALDKLDDGITMHDSEFRLVYTNLSAITLLDLPVSLMRPGTPLEDVFRFNAERGDYGPGDVDAMVSERVALLKLRQAHCFERRRPDGTVLEIKGAPLEDGGFISIYKDVTERRQFAEKLREANASLEEKVKERTRELAYQSALLEATVEHISQGISVFDKDLRLALCNDRFMKLLNLPDGFSEVGTELSRFFTFNAERGEYGDGDINELVEERLEKARDPQPHSFRRVLNDGTVIEIEGNPMPVITGGFVTTYADVTETVRAQEEALAAKEDAEKALTELRETQETLIQAEKIAALGHLVAGIAHEINTPVGVGLTVVTHMTDRLDGLKGSLESGQIKKSDLTAFCEKADEAFELIRGNLERAADLISSFKKIAVDQTSEERREFNVAEYTRNVFHSLLPQFKESNIKIELVCDEAIEMDSFPGAFAQVVSNLMINSLEHAYKPGESGTIRLLIEEKDGMVRVEHCDDGCGIAEENVARVFDPFFRKSMGGAGTGLGLSVVYNIVQAKLCGDITCQSREGEGAVFIVELPKIVPDRGNHPCGVAPAPDR